MISAALASGSAATLQSGEHALQFTSSEDGTTQPYRLFVPTKAVTTSPLPLVVVLHGWGVDETAWFKFTPVKNVAEQFGYVVAAPYARGNWWYRGPAERDVLDTIADVSRRLPIASDRIYLVGHSMGGWGTWWIGCRHPDLFAAIAPMAGFDPREWVLNAVNLAPWVVHDQLDEIVPVELSRSPVRRMAELGISHSYREEIGYGHASRMIGDNLARVFTWFDNHPRIARPSRSAVASRQGARNRWLVLVRSREWPKLASVDAVVDAQGAMRITTNNVDAIALHLSELPSRATFPLRVQVDSWETTMTQSRGWVVLERSSAGLKKSRSKSGTQWKATMADKAPPLAAPPPIRGTVGELLREAHERGNLAQAIAEILRDHYGAQVCVLDADKVRVARGSLTTEKLLDAWVHPVERLVRMHLSRAEILRLQESISKGRPLTVPEAQLLPARGRLTVVLPTAIAAQLPRWQERAELLSDSIGETLTVLATSSR